MFFSYFRPPCLCPSEVISYPDLPRSDFDIPKPTTEIGVRGTPTWRLHTKLYKFVWNILSNNSSTEYRTDLTLGQVSYLLIIYSMPISWLHSWNGFIFFFAHTAISWQWKPAIATPWLNIVDTMFCFSSFSFLSRKKSFPLYQVLDLINKRTIQIWRHLNGDVMLSWSSNIMCAFLSIHSACESMEANGH